MGFLLAKLTQDSAFLAFETESQHEVWGGGVCVGGKNSLESPLDLGVGNQVPKMRRRGSRPVIAVSGERWAGKWEGSRNWWSREGMVKVYFLIKLTE